MFEVDPWLNNIHLQVEKKYVLLVPISSVTIWTQTFFIRKLFPACRIIWLQALSTFMHMIFEQAKTCYNDCLGSRVSFEFVVAW